MPVNKCVPSLLTLTTAASCNWLLACTIKWKGVQARRIQRAYVFSAVDTNIRQRLLAKVMSTNMYEMDLDYKIMMLELLGDQSTLIVDVTKSGYQYIEEIFSLYRALTYGLVINLNTLGIVCLIKGKVDGKFIGDVNSIFYRTMMKMKFLTTITMRGIADTEMMSIIGKTCPLLEYLDISRSQRIDDDSIAALITNKADSLVSLWDGKIDHVMAKCHPCCRKIKFLGITETEITSQVACSLLQLMPNLTSFGGYLHHASMCSAITFLYGEKVPRHYDKILKLDVYDVFHNSCLVQICVADVDVMNVFADDNNFQHLSNDNESECCEDNESFSESETDLILIPEKLQLTHLWDVLISKQQCQVLTKVCPDVFAIDTGLSSLEALKNFHPLRELYVDCDFKKCVNNLLTYLESSGLFLESILVRDTIGDFLSVHYLRELCPNLKSVNLPLDCLDINNNNSESWNSLMYANITMPSSRSFATFCSLAVNITELFLTLSIDPYIESFENMNDTVILNILKSGGLLKVKKVCFGKCFFSGKALNSFFSYCPDLKTVGYIDLWNRLTANQVSKARLAIIENNWDLKLVTSADFPGNQLHFK